MKEKTQLLFIVGNTVGTPLRSEINVSEIMMHMSNTYCLLDQILERMNIVFITQYIMKNE